MINIHKFYLMFYILSIDSSTCYYCFLLILCLFYVARFSIPWLGMEFKNPEPLVLITKSYHVYIDWQLSGTGDNEVRGNAAELEKAESVIRDRITDIECTTGYVELEHVLALTALAILSQ